MWMTLMQLDDRDLDKIESKREFFELCCFSDNCDGVIGGRLQVCDVLKNV